MRPRSAGIVDLDGEAALLDEITNLVEAPDADPRQLRRRATSSCPPQVLTTVMRKHQRYLPVRERRRRTLLPHFVAVANGAVRPTNWCAAGQRGRAARPVRGRGVLLARRPARSRRRDFKAGLAKLTFDERPRLDGRPRRPDRRHRGSLARARRVCRCRRPATLDRAGELAKFDLASQMVVELSSLAGTMAGRVRPDAGEPEAVATALVEMELPRSRGRRRCRDRCPARCWPWPTGSTCWPGCSPSARGPTGSSDPFGLRRAALGVITILRSRPDLAEVTISGGLAAAAERLRRDGVDVSQQALDEASEFIARRYEQAVLDGGADHRQVQAVLPLADRPAAADAALADLESLVDDEDFVGLTAALQRSRRLVPADMSADYDVAALTDPTELALHEAVIAAAPAVRSAGTLGEFAAAAGPLAAPINTFFDHVLVMADDPAVRAARLGLLATINTLAVGRLDWSALG